MNNLIVNFVGMSLIVGDGTRSEALLIDTNGTNHSHRHRIVVNDIDYQVDNAVVWVEENGTQLSGGLVDGATDVARAGDLNSKDRLHPSLATTDPLHDRRWKSRLAVWVRLPGGNVKTTPTPGPGGESLWEVPSFNGQPDKQRHFTQFATMTRTNVTGQVRVVILQLAGGSTTPVDVNKDANQDSVITIVTEYYGPDVPEPDPGDRVEMNEMQLVYNCLNGGKGPIPFVASWPNKPQVRTIPRSDPATGICPIAMADLP